MQDPRKTMKELLALLVENNASDLHLSVGHPPVLRIARELTAFSKYSVLKAEDVYQLAAVLMTKEQRIRLEKERDVDFSATFGQAARFRINVYYQKDVLGVAIRFIPNEIRTIEELHLPEVLHRFTEINQGFVIITGPSSHGKSTTMAALIDEINRSKAKRIITIEDPIEFVFQPEQSVIEQREVFKDALSFSRALRATFRQDPDVIMVGEMRDAETMATALTAAETGHLVFATLHTNSAAQTIHRIVDSFPAEQQSQVRSQLSSSLSGIISQRLLPRIHGGLIPAVEVLVSTPAVSNLIRENKVHEIPFVVDTSVEEGMVSLNRTLASLVRNGEISIENALRFSLDSGELQNLVQQRR